MDHIMEIVDPEIIDADLYKLQNELSFLEVQNQVSKLFLEGRII